MGISSKTETIDEHIKGLVVDGVDVLHHLSKISRGKDEPIEIVADLPAATDPDLIIGCVSRWNEIQKHFNADLRVYAWSYNTKVEKYVLGCVQNMSRITVTVLPFCLKETMRYGK